MIRLMLAVLCVAAAWGWGGENAAQGQTLYNGIQLPAVWPPRDYKFGQEPVKPPYLAQPPALIPIDLGRQLFVDDFLIEQTTLQRTFYAAQYHPASPVLKREKPWEQDGRFKSAMVFSDGVWHDPQDNLFKLWYFCPNKNQDRGGTAYATSKDGIHWERPQLDVVTGTNVVCTAIRDSNTVWLDLFEKDPARRFKMFSVPRPADNHIELSHSPDGIHWSAPAVGTGRCEDRTTVFYNPFRKVWVYSIKITEPGPVRIRHYWEHADAVAGMNWNGPPFWCAADKQDYEPAKLPGAQIYNLDGVAYESVMLGLFSLLRDQPKDRPKRNEIFVGFSRDGFHWDRGNRTPLVPIGAKPGDWNAGNIQSAGGCCLIVGDKLYIYCSGRCEQREGDTGLAILRRDGFASMDAGAQTGTLTTRPVQFKGKHLFVNVDAPQGSLKVEILDKNGKAIAPFSADQCVPVCADGTLQAVAWKGGGDLSALAGQPVKFRFHLTNGKLYAFWVSPDRSGASHGYVAAGGPGFTGPTDTVGVKALDEAARLANAAK